MRLAAMLEIRNGFKWVIQDSIRPIILFIIFIFILSDCQRTIDKLHKMMLVKPEQFKFF